MSDKAVPWAEIARNRKVHNLVSYMRGVGIGSDEAALCDARMRNAIARRAEVKPPSATTWDQVVEKLARLESGDDRDPFEGLE